MNEDKNSIDRDTAFDLLTSTFSELKEKWGNYKRESYEDYQTERLDYVDIGEVACFIVSRLQTGQTDRFDEFFDRVETILDEGDDYTTELMVIGLLEGIQNASARDDNLDYRKDFDKWLRPKTLNVWRELIEFWNKVDRWKG